MEKHTWQSRWEMRAVLDQLREVEVTRRDSHWSESTGVSEGIKKQKHQNPLIAIWEMVFDPASLNAREG